MSTTPVTGDILSGLAGDLIGPALKFFSGWILDGVKAAVEAVARVIGQASSPDLLAGWFSTNYFRVAALAALLTVPFLFAAAVQAVIRSDLGLLLRAALVDLPVALLAVFIASPVTMLLLGATDEMCSIVTGGPGTAVAALGRLADGIGGISAVNGSAFLAVLMGLIAMLGAVGLMLELLIRAAAVYVVVLMLPLAFAGLVWPARRVWAKRIAELLIALILSKFAIVAILSLAASGIAGSGLGSYGTLLVAMTMLVLATFAPWALLRLLPFTEVAAAVAGSMRGEAQSGFSPHLDRASPIAAALTDDPAAEIVRNMTGSARGDDRSPDVATPQSTRAAAGGEAQSSRDGDGDDVGSDWTERRSGLRGAVPAHSERAQATTSEGEVDDLGWLTAGTVAGGPSSSPAAAAPADTPAGAAASAPPAGTPNDGQIVAGRQPTAADPGATPSPTPVGAPQMNADHEPGPTPPSPAQPTADSSGSTEPPGSLADELPIMAPDDTSRINLGDPNQGWLTPAELEALPAPELEALPAPDLEAPPAPDPDLRPADGAPAHDASKPPAP